MTDLDRRFVTVAALNAAAAALTGCGNRQDPDEIDAVPQPGVSAPEGPVPFPLRVRKGSRYLVDADGQPFFVHGDSPWSIEVQLTRDQVLTYLDVRQQQGFTTIMFEAIEHEFSSQTPPWKNAEGNVPFEAPYDLPFVTPQFFRRPVEAYWRFVDYVIVEANRRGIACILHPAYLGYGGGSQGWTAEVLATSTEDLQRYGRWLARRYRHCGVIWCLGGDYSGAAHPGLLTRQWEIATGILGVDSDAVITAHGARGQSAYSVWGGFAGLNLNNVYTDGLEYEYAATEYARPEALPFFLIEGRYDADGATPADCRRQAYVAVLSGGCGHMFGNTPVWGFGEPRANGGAGPAAVLASSLTTTATTHMQHVKQLFTGYPWWTLTPRTDSTLVTTDLGQGKSRICPALAQDGSFAMIWTTGSAVTVNMAALSSRQVRARWYDTTTGTYTPARDLSLANLGLQTFTPAGESVLVLDGAAHDLEPPSQNA